MEISPYKLFDSINYSGNGLYYLAILKYFGHSLFYIEY